MQPPFHCSTPTIALNDLHPATNVMYLPKYIFALLLLRRGRRRRKNKKRGKQYWSDTYLHLYYKPRVCALK